jgi:undecaprenyl-diphosphatase
MIVATGYDLLKTLHPNASAATEAIAPLTMDAHRWIILAIGFIVSFFVALGVVEWFLSWVRRHGLAPFAIYRILAGVLLIVAVLCHWL